MNGIWETNAWTLFQLGGPIMYPIMICSILSFGIFMEKIYYFFRIRINVLKVKREIFDLLKSNKIKEAIQHCDSTLSPIPKVLKAGIIKLGASKDELKESMESVSLTEIPKLENRLDALATIAHIAPLLGLLGTVTGMTASFHTIQQRAATMNPVTPGDLAGSIGEALLTTVAGLIVAIPTYVAYNYCVNRINNFVLEMERAATDLMNFASHTHDINV